MSKVTVSAATFAMVKAFAGGYRAPQAVADAFLAAHKASGRSALNVTALSVASYADRHRESPADCTHGLWTGSNWEWMSRGDMWADECLAVAETVRAFEVSADWLAACGQGSIAAVFPIIREYKRAGIPFVTVLERNGAEWVVMATADRGRFVEIDAAEDAAFRIEAARIRDASARFHKWFNGLTVAARETEDGAAMLEAGLEIWHSGGGCTAWTLDAGNDWLVIVTDGDAGHVREDGESWLIGVIGPDGHYFHSHREAETTAEAIETARRFAVAIRFAANLRRDLSDDEWESMLRRNTAEIDSNADSGICHSHDFTDANMQMLEAFESTYGRAVDFEVESDIAAMADAWNVAKAELLRSMADAPLFDNDGTLDAFVRAECEALDAECDGDVFGQAFGGKPSNGIAWTRLEAAEIVAAGVRGFGLKRDGKESGNA